MDIGAKDDLSMISSHKLLAGVIGFVLLACVGAMVTTVTTVTRWGPQIDDMEADISELQGSLEIDFTQSNGIKVNSDEILKLSQETQKNQDEIQQIQIQMAEARGAKNALEE